MTTAEYLQTPETTLPGELIYGQWRVAEAPSTSHQRTVRELLIALADETATDAAGEVLCAPIDVVLDFDGDLVVQPDLVFVSKARSEIVRERIYGGPDLVIEVLSPRPRIGSLEERIAWFARYGVRECWLADLERKEIAVLALHPERGVTGRTVFAGTRALVSQVLPFTGMTAFRAFGY